MTDQHNTNKCGLYGRVSTDRQARMQEGGLDTQFNQMERRVEYENGNGQDKEWRIVERYREEGWSGKNLERPEFRRMMQDIKSGRINTVIVYKIDRITRSLSDFLELWKVFEEHNVEFISLHEKFDTTTAVGRAMLKLILVFAELEREQTSERTKATMRHRAEQGLDNGRAKILGYDRDPNQKGILFVNEEEVRLVREHVFEKLIELGSAGAVTRHLRQAGIRKPQYTTRRENTRGGGHYQKQEVIRMLTDVVYLGQVKYDGEAFEGRHEAIVDQDLFDRAQAILERNRITRNNDRNERNHVYLLRSLIRCGRCGAMMTPKHCQGRKAVRSYYYTCSRQSHSAGEACNAKYVPADAAEEYVLDEIRRLATDSDLIAETVSQANGNRDGQLERMGIERRSLQRRLQDVQNRISRVMTAIETEPDLGTLGERLAELEAEKLAMEDELDGLDEEIEVTRLAAISAKRMIASYRTLPQVLDALQKEGDRYAIRELLGRLIEVIEWTQNEDDPSRGTVEIMLFEQQLPAGEGVASAKETRDDPLVTSGCVTSNGRLPR